MVDKPKIVLGICSMRYTQKTVDDFFHLMTKNYLYGFIDVHTTLIHHARNQVVRATFDKFPDFTHILFVDDDMCDFDDSKIQALVDADEDIISALVTQRRKPYTAVCTGDYSPEEVIKFVEEGRIVPSVMLGMAFTLIKRHVFETIIEETPDGRVWFTFDRDPRPGFYQEFPLFLAEQKERFEKEHNLDDVIKSSIVFGQTAHLGSILTGEDVSFIRRAIKYGFGVFVHCGVIVGHIGEKICNIRDTILEPILEKARCGDSGSVGF